MKPMSQKSPGMIKAIESIFPGTVEAIRQEKCPCCFKPIEGFKDALSAKEYMISGMCQDCQDSVFE